MTLALETGLAEANDNFEQAWVKVQDLLQHFALTGGLQVQTVEVAFGSELDEQALVVLQEQWSSGDFSALPEIELRSNLELSGAWGAYVAATDRVYLSQSFLTTASQSQIVAVILEEIGHSIDTRINTVDSRGDEGAIFSALVRGEEFSAEKLQRLQIESDRIQIEIDGQILTAEAASSVTVNSSKALSLDGVDDTVSIPDSDAIDFGTGQNFTVEAWVKADLTQLDTGNGDNDIIEKWGVGGGGYPYVIRYDRATGKIVAARYDGTNNPAIVSTATINDGQYHHIAFVKDGANLTLYIDGQSSGTIVDTTGNAQNNSPLFIGSRNGDNHFAGEVDELRLWNVARTQAEIQAALNTELTGTEPGLVGYYTFDDGAATDLVSGNNGTLVGGVSTVESLITRSLTATANEDDEAFTVDLLSGVSDSGSVVSNITLVSGNAAGVFINGNRLRIEPQLYRALNPGESEGIAYRYDLTDSSGDTFTQTVSVTINGVNDAPVITFGIQSVLTPSSLNGKNGFILNGANAYDEVGSSISNAGDINGDGIDDLIIGAYRAAPNGNSLAGASYVVFGNTTGFAASIDLSSLNGSNGFALNGVNARDYASVVSGIGDINGDGLHDLIIGARGADPNGNFGAGESYVVFGRSSGFAASFDLSNLDGSNGFILSGLVPADRLGTSVSGAGDINGDGIDDFIIGAPDADPNGTIGAGTSYVVFGRTSGFGASFALSSLDGSNGFVLNGAAEQDDAGTSVSRAGDVNGDGIDDLIIGAQHADLNGQYSIGKSYVVFGRVNGFASSIDLSTLDGSNGFALNGIDAYDQSGNSVSGAGDINGDGFDDIIIGARFGDPNGFSQAGESYVVFGQSGFGASLDLSSLDGSNGFVLNGSSFSSRSGGSVSSAGDVNEDGYDDLIIGARFSGLTGTSTPPLGESYVVFGSSSGFSASFNLSSLDGSNGFTFNNSRTSNFSDITSVSHAGDINGDGIDDVLIADRRSGIGGQGYVVFGGNIAAQVNIVENTTAVTTLTATDVNNDTLTYSITGGADSSLFSVDSSLGTLSFQQAPNFETPLDHDSNNVYEVEVTVSDGNGGSDSQLVSVTVEDVNEFPTFTSATTLSVAENTTVATTVTASDQDGDLLTYSITGGTDRDRFKIAPQTGILSFRPAPDFENPQDSDGNNLYEVEVTVSDGQGGNISQLLSIQVQDLNEAPVITSGTQSVLTSSSLNGKNGFIINGANAYDEAGSSVSNAGDINGDGIDDLIIGAFRADPNGNSSAGASYVVFGNTTGFAASVDLSSLDGSNGFALNGVRARDYARVVSGIGDINGDGLHDLIVGADGADPNGNSLAGESYVVFGRSSGFPSSFDLSSLDGNNGFILSGLAPVDRLGTSVSGAGDINGDGIDDFIMGAPDADPNGLNRAGTSYVVFGRTSGFGTSFALSSLNGSNGFVLNGSEAGSNSGYSVSRAGDVNGDGIDDLIIGAQYAASNGQSLAGRSYVVFGSTNGFAASIDLSNLDGSNGFALNGIDAYDISGYAVSGAGDINGDGFDDIIIGARSGDPNGVSQAGESYVVFGQSGFGASLDLSSLDGSNGFVLNGSSVASRAGGSVSSAGDVNEDGYDDLIIGARFSGATGTSTSPLGESYVVFGRSSGFSASFNLSSLDGSNGFTFNNSRSTNSSATTSVSHAGDINGDGIDDVLIADRNSGIGGQGYVVFGGNIAAQVNIVENTTAVTTITATDVNNDTLTYSITGGADSSLFSVDSSLGTLSFQQAPNFETPLDHDSNNVYEVEVTVSDGNGGNDSQLVSVTVEDVNEFPTFTSATTLSVAENTTVATAVMASDQDGDLLTYSITGGTDRDRFKIAPQTGVLSFRPAPDFENPQDSDGNNLYEVEVTVSDGQGGNISQLLSIQVQDLNEAPVITSGTQSVLTSSSLNGNNGFTLNGVNVGDNAGSSVSNAGDINGDGIDDFIIGADSADSNGNNSSGVSYVIFGDTTGFAASMDLSSLNGSNGFALNGVNALDRASTVSGVGDINGDGLHDLIIGARRADPNGNSLAGESYVVFGSSSGFAASIDLSSLDGSTGFILSGLAPGDKLGTSVSGAGDINGDGIDDFIIGAPNGFNGLAGTSYVVFGRTNGFDASFALSSLDGNNGFVLNGSAVGSQAGYSVSRAGDVNGDGIDDLIVGARYADSNGQSQAGQSHVIFGSINGFAASIALSSLDGSNGFTLNGIDAYDNSGESVSGAGDINGDGFDDIIIGARLAAPNGVSQAGESYVVFGQSAFGASFDLSSLDGSNGFVLNGSSTGSRSGASVSSAGDVNEDGYDDLIIGARFVQSTVPNTPHLGQSHVFFGHGSGFSSSFNLSSLDGSNGFTFNNISPNASPPSVSHAGDINGDGVDDILIAEKSRNQGYVIFGGNSHGQVNVAENTTAVMTVTARDDDGDALTYSIIGGADASLFSITNDGQLAFLNPPTVAAPIDSNGDNIYIVEIQVSDGMGGIDTQTLEISVLPNNPPTAVSFQNSVTTLAENTDTTNRIKVADIIITDDLVGSETITLSGTNASVFEADATGLYLKAGTSLNFESQTSYTVTVNVDDLMVGSTPDVTADFTLGVTNVDEAPSVSVANATVNENQTAVTTASATDPDAGDAAPVFSLSGTDAALFSIDSAGVITFNSAPNFESPQDQDNNNQYDLTVVATDGNNPALSTSQNLTVTVQDVNEAPILTVNSITVNENQTSVTTAIATDPENATPPLFSLSGTDAALFSIDSAGVITFNSAPNFESPQDAGANNVYDVTVTATDGAVPSLSSSQTIAITVADVTELSLTASKNTVTESASDTATFTISRDSGLIGQALTVQ